MATLFYESLTRSISTERLAAYKVYPCEPKQQVFERYFWNLALARDFYPLLQNLEISLRNNINSEAARLYRTEYWFDLPFMRDRQADEVRNARDTVARYKGIAPPRVNAGAIIAELNFGFWVNLFNRPYSGFFTKISSGVFSSVPKSLRTIIFLRARLENIRRFRNRVFHHEPIWNNPKLTDMHNEILETIYWIDPVLYDITHTMSSFKDTLAAGIQPLGTERNQRASRPSAS